MKIQDKFALYIFFIVVMFLIVSSFLSYWYNKSVAINTALELMQVSVVEASSHLGDRLVEKSKIAISMASSDTLLRELARSNMEYDKLSDAVRGSRIKYLNTRWVNTPGVENAFVKSYMHNSVASLLKLHQQSFPDEIGEIFVTNRYGLAIGTTNKLSTLAHSHKYWWKAANNNGRGKIFFDDRGYDESVGDYVIGIVVPIKINNQVVGILKCNFMLLASLSYLQDGVGDYGDLPGHKVVLARSSGRVIVGEGVTPLSVMLPDIILDKMNLSSPSSIIISIDNIEHIVSYSPVGLTYSSEKYSFGGRYISSNRVGADNQKGWFLLFIDNVESVLSPTVNTISWFIYAGLILAFLAGITALLIGRKVAQPIRFLTEQANRIGRGDIGESSDINSSDELGKLAQAFNQMSHDLRETHSELQRKERLATLGQLTATVSHELRNPLGAMRPSLYVIDKKSDKKDERVQKAIERIDRNIDRCDDIIDELLDFTRITKLKRHVTRVDEWLESVIDEQDILKDIQVEKALNLKNFELAIDTDRLRRAVINVVENACHAMTDNKYPMTKKKGSCLHIKTMANDKSIEISITDTGTGIAKDVLKKIFEPLFSTKGFGVGLGMSTVKQIMEQHGGGVEIGSEEGRGTTVTLWLPSSTMVKDGDEVAA